MGWKRDPDRLIVFELRLEHVVATVRAISADAAKRALAARHDFSYGWMTDRVEVECKGPDLAPGWRKRAREGGACIVSIATRPEPAETS